MADPRKDKDYDPEIERRNKETIRKDVDEDQENDSGRRKP